MLTKDLLRYKVSGAYAKPSFISVSDPRLLDLAERLIAVFENSIGTTREELDEHLDRLTLCYNDIKLARGLVKSCPTGRSSPAVPIRITPRRAMPCSCAVRPCSIRLIVPPIQWNSVPGLWSRNPC